MTFVGRRGATDALGRMQREKEEEEGVKCSLTNLLGSRKSVLLSLSLSPSLSFPRIEFARSLLSHLFALSHLRI